MNPAYPGGFEILAAGRPDYVVLQHAPKRVEYDGFPGYPLHPLPEQIRAIVNNCLDGLEADWADLVLCNPPFHQQNAITDHIAWQMFCDAQQVLRPRGQLIVIGNRQLGYDEKMKRIFGNVKKIAQNSKFIIYLSGK